jgi:hypothetical protein
MKVQSHAPMEPGDAELELGVPRTTLLEVT